MNAQVMTYGNLALSIEDACPLDYRPRFEVVEGGRSRDRVRGCTAAAPASCSKRSKALSIAIAFVMGAVLFGTFLSFELSAENAYSSALASAPREEITVNTGDTLWALANEHPISGLSTADTVNVIAEWNELQGGCLHPGDLLLVPSVS